jgi:hypothetical protein
MVSGSSKARRAEIRRALDLCVSARDIFNDAKPKYPKSHHHFVVVNSKELIASLEQDDATEKLQMSRHELSIVQGILETEARKPITPTRRETRFKVLKGVAELARMARGKDNNSPDVGSSAATKDKEDSQTSLGSRFVSSRLRNPDEVSFTMFLLALKSVCAPKCVSSKRGSILRKSVVEAKKSGENTYSEYLV